MKKIITRVLCTQTVGPVLTHATIVGCNETHEKKINDFIQKEDLHPERLIKISTTPMLTDKQYVITSIITFYLYFD